MSDDAEPLGIIIDTRGGGGKDASKSSARHTVCGGDEANLRMNKGAYRGYIEVLAFSSWGRRPESITLREILG